MILLQLFAFIYACAPSQATPVFGCANFESAERRRVAKKRESGFFLSVDAWMGGCFCFGRGADETRWRFVDGRERRETMAEACGAAGVQRVRVLLRERS